MWNDPPDMSLTEQAYKNRTRVNALILRKNRAIQKAEDNLKEKYPRKPELRRKEMEILLDELLELQVQKQEVDDQIEFYNLWSKMFISYSYRK